MRLVWLLWSIATVFLQTKTVFWLAASCRLGWKRSWGLCQMLPADCTLPSDGSSLCGGSRGGEEEALWRGCFDLLGTCEVQWVRQFLDRTSLKSKNPRFCFAGDGERLKSAEVKAGERPLRVKLRSESLNLKLWAQGVSYERKIRGLFHVVSVEWSRGFRLMLQI